MKILHSVQQLREIEKGSIVTVGNFDGVHIGHQEILSTAKQLADKKQAELLLITFDPHPMTVLAPGKAPAILTPQPLKERLLEKLGVDCWLILKPDHDILSLSGPDFIEEYVVKPITPAALVEGEDFSFGAGRSGNIELLQRIGPVNGFDVVVVPTKKIELEQTVRISSTMIRYMLSSGNISNATIALGRPYELIGRVVSGRGKGRQIGFPTLNLEKPDQLVPAEGVYAGYVTLGHSDESTPGNSGKLPAAFSIGQARTFEEDHPMLIEAHLLTDKGISPDDSLMAMEFIAHIRTQHKFASPEHLAEQIAKDCDNAKRLLNK